MTGPAAGEPREAPTRTARTRDGASAIIVVLALGLALRLIIAYLLPGSGFGVDLGAFRYWADNLAREGLGGFYDRPFFHDYTPGYLYVLWAVGMLGHALGGIGDLIKIPPILADAALGWLAWSMTLELGARRRTALLAGIIVVANPITWFDSVVWGQVDSVGVVFLLLGVRELWRDRPERSAVFTVIAAVTKPQLGILIPIVAAVTIRRALWPSGAYGDEPIHEWPSGTTGWEIRARGWIRIATTGVAGLATAIALSFPFGLSLPGLVTQIFKTAGGYPYLSVNAYNPWALLSLRGTGIAANSGWVCDIAMQPGPGVPNCPVGYTFGPIPALVVGLILLVIAFVAVTLIVARRPDRLTILVGVTVLAMAFFILPTRVHERYLFPLAALGAILAALSFRWRIAYVASSAATLANMYVVLTTLYPDNPSVADWLGIGPAIRSTPGVWIIALTQLAVFIWIAVQLRERAVRRLARDVAGADEAADGVATAAGVAAAAAATAAGAAPPALGSAAGDHAAADGSDVDDGQRDDPTPNVSPPNGGPAGVMASIRAGRPVRAFDPPTQPYGATAWAGAPPLVDLGIWGWFRARLSDRASRPDRSRGLHGEPGGRLDRLDLWLVVVLTVSVLTLRMWRLEQPYTMHFDEVYHARTATEFLQDWRYGISHDIYEWTHPHLAKYAMAMGLVAFGDDRITAESSLGIPIRAAAIEPRWDERDTATARNGDRFFVASGGLVRAYDLATEALVATVSVPGASALDVDTSQHRLIIGTDGGDILTLDTTALDDARAAGGKPDAAAYTIGHVDGAIRALHVTSDGAAILVGLGPDRLVTIDAVTGQELGRETVPGYSQMADAGTTPAVVAVPNEVTDAAAEASALSKLVSLPAASIRAQLQGQAALVVIAAAPSGSPREQLDKAIAGGELTGITVRQEPRVAVAGQDGVTFISTGSGKAVTTVAVGGPAGGLALVTGIDADKLYVSVAAADGPTISIVSLPSDASTQLTVTGTIHLPGQASWLAYDSATQMVHVLGQRSTAAAPLSGTTGAVTAPAGSASAAASAPPTVYVIEPHAKAVYADAPLDFQPAALLLDADPRYPTTDREQILALAADGTTASVDIGRHELAWRLPGVVAGALEAALIFVLVRLLFRRRSIALIAGLLILADGMLFVQSRIGMNDAYVALFIVAAYVLFAAIWTGAWRGWAAFWLAMPVIGLLLGLALASKWVAAYAIAALGILILARSALGRVVIILGMILATTVLGSMAITVPAGSNGANNLFLLIMIGLTLIAVVASVLHPIAWSWEEFRLAIGAPIVAGIAVGLVALAAGKLDARLTFGHLTVTPIETSFALLVAAGLLYAIFVVVGPWGFGPLASRPSDPSDPSAFLEPPAPAPTGWLRPGALLGLPAVWMVLCLVGLPLAVYVASYIPWAFVENHRIVAGWPAGHTGQTLAELTVQMYQYHNGLVAAHPAQSPWWAWPFDLKPVWFYQGSFAGGTSAAIYDSGNLVIWWLGVPAMAFVAWQAFARRSLPLALLAVGFAWQWLAWSRIDRAAFEYHYYTSLPFVIIALAYFLAELWHGASRRTWLLARLTAGAAVVAPMALWLLHRPLCAFVRVTSVNPGSQACPTLIPSFILTGRTLAIAVVVGVGVLLLVRQFMSLTPSGETAEGDAGGLRRLVPVAITAAATMLGLAVVSTVFHDTPMLTLTAVPVEPIALVLLLPLLGIAAFVAAARDARRFVMGALMAVVAWFLIWYPNLSALPLPAAVANAYQGLLPTYVYPFQFPVSAVDRNSISTPLLALGPALLLVSLAVTCVVVAYTAWVWRLAAAERAASGDGGPPRSGDLGMESGR